MLVASFPAGPLQANCYLVARDRGAGCAVVDPSQARNSSVDMLTG